VEGCEGGWWSDVEDVEEAIAVEVEDVAEAGGVDEATSIAEEEEVEGVVDACTVERRDGGIITPGWEELNGPPPLMLLMNELWKPGEEDKKYC